jgi:hypothetical protein
MLVIDVPCVTCWLCGSDKKAGKDGARVIRCLCMDVIRDSRIILQALQNKLRDEKKRLKEEKKVLKKGGVPASAAGAGEGTSCVCTVRIARCMHVSV